MASSVRDDGTISINDLKYNLALPLAETYLSPLPGKVNMGGDSFAQENILSNWIQKDRRGGILINEMDESIHSNRAWWTNCIISHDGHLTLPRLATEISTFNALAGGWKDPTSDNAGWSNSAQAYNNNTGDFAEFGVSNATWTNWLELNIDPVFCKEIRIWPSGNVTGASGIYKMTIDVYYDGGWNNIYNNTEPNWGTYNTIAITPSKLVSAARIKFYNNYTSTRTAYIYEFDFGQDTTAPSGTIGKAAEFNGESYRIIGNYLCKLKSGRAAYDAVQGFNDTPAGLISSLNNRLYIMMGDTKKYYWMDTSEAFTQSNSSAFYYGVEANGLLYKMNSTGTFASSNDPDGGSPTWNNLADITTDSDKIEGLFRGRDADGNFVVYLRSNTTMQVHDATNNLWLPTELRLPDHPNGGKGAIYWNDAHYLPYGLGIKKYVTGAVASISEVGLDREGGLPIEYNGEIVAFCADSQYFLAALVDASQTSGNSQSGLYIWTGMAWECWWVDPSNNGVMHDVVVSSAESGYAIYWDCGGTIFYIDLPRGVQNVRQLSGTQKFEASGIYLSPNFDAGTIAYAKLVQAITSYAKSVTSTSKITIKYRTDHDNEDRDTGWTELVVLDTAGENGAVETLLASGAGLSFDSIQYRLDFVRGSTSTDSPDLLALVTAYMLKKKGNRAWTFTILIDGEAQEQTTDKQQYDNIWTAIKLSTLVKLNFRNADVNEEHYVQLFLAGGSTRTGDHYGGFMSLQAVEV